MKTWRIAVIASLALVAVALVTTSAYAYMGGRAATTPYGTNTGVPSPYGNYGGGMMGWFSGTPTTAMSVTVDQAKANAQQFLNANYPGTTVGDGDTFYGYYHFDVQLSGSTYGMLSVNGYTGQVWYHTWHGTFVQQVKL